MSSLLAPCSCRSGSFQPQSLAELLQGPKLVGHSNFTHLRRNLVGLTEPGVLIDLARRRQNHFGKKFPRLVSRELALLGI